MDIYNPILFKEPSEIVNEFLPKGFYSCSKNVGIKDSTLDFMVVYSSVPATSSAMFTKNRLCGAPLVIGKENILNNQLQGIVVNSKNANVATGEKGVANVREIVSLVGEELGIDPTNILPSSTGVIGQHLPMEKIRAGIKGVRKSLVRDDFFSVAKAIMTTDTRPKIRVCKVGEASIVAIAKGSGMIEPNMATLLTYFFTDAKIESKVLDDIFKQAINQSFNMVSVDTDTSTSDTAVIMANGLAGEVDINQFQEVLTNMSIELAKDIASDGEGATKLLEVMVEEASSFSQAKRIAKNIVNSPLVKTAIFGKDPNWGRVFMAIGKSEDELESDKLSISFGDIQVYLNGEPQMDDTLEQLVSYFENDKIQIKVSLGNGNQCATVWGSDLSYEYVRINAEYTT